MLGLCVGNCNKTLGRLLPWIHHDLLQALFYVAITTTRYLLDYITFVW